MAPFTNKIRPRAPDNIKKRKKTLNNKKDDYRQLNVRQLGSLRPWDHRGKCYMDRKRI